MTHRPALRSVRRLGPVAVAAVSLLAMAAPAARAAAAPPTITFPTAPLTTGEQYIRVQGTAAANARVHIFKDTNGDGVRQWTEDGWDISADADGSFSLKIYLNSDTSVSNLRADAEVGDQESTSVKLPTLTHRTGAGPVIYPAPANTTPGRPAPVAPAPAQPAPDAPAPAQAAPVAPAPAPQPAGDSCISVSSPLAPVVTGDVIVPVTGTAAPGQYVQVFEDANGDGAYAFPELTFHTFADRDGRFSIDVVLQQNSTNANLYLQGERPDGSLCPPQQLPTMIEDLSLPPTAAPATASAADPVQADVPTAPADAPQPGFYSCWYWHTRVIPEFSTELDMSAMGSIEIGADGSYHTALNATRPEGLTYSEENTTGTYSFDAGGNQFAFNGGWLEGANAYLRVGDTGVLDIVFPKALNQVDGKGRIDTSDTICSYKHG